MKLQGDELRSFIEQYANEITQDGKWKYIAFYIGKYIPEKKLKNAVSSYAQLSDGEAPLILLDNSKSGDAKEGMLLTTSNLYYNLVLCNEHRKDTEYYLKYLLKNYKAQKGCIPLSDIQSAFFEVDDVVIPDWYIKTQVGTLYLNSKPFANTSGYLENGYFVLDKLLSKINTDNVDIKLMHPVWLFDREELNDIMLLPDIKIFITNARIVITPSYNCTFQGTPSRDQIFYAIELSSIREINTPKFSGIPVITLQDGSEERFNVNTEYIRAVMEHMIPVITFEEPDEKILFKIRVDGKLCSDKFWETIFGREDEYRHATFCVTNKRLLCYYVDQISGLHRDMSTIKWTINWTITPPNFKWCWLPLSGIASITKGKKDLHTSLHIKNCAPVGGSSRSSVIPKISSNDSSLKYDQSYIGALEGTSVVDFSILDNVNKKNREEIIEILRSLLPGVDILQEK